MPAIPELHERLTDGEVELRLSAEWDIPDILIAHQDDPGLHRALGLPRPPSGADLGSAAEREPSERAAGAAVRLTIVEPGREDCRGRVEADEIDWEARTARVVVWVAPQLRGQGVARRALRLAAGWLLGPIGLERLTLAADAGNLALIRAARAAGFREERPETGERAAADPPPPGDPPPPTVLLELRSGGGPGRDLARDPGSQELQG